MSAIAAGAHANAHAHIHMNNMQNTDTPDINLERDLLPEEIALGLQTGENVVDANKKFKVNIVTIIISALIFLAILAWFDFAQTTFYACVYPPTQEDNIPAWAKLWYAVAITATILIIIGLLLYYFWDSLRI